MQEVQIPPNDLEKSPKRLFREVLSVKLLMLGNCKSPSFVIPNEVRNLRAIDIKRFLPLVEMTVGAFFDFCNYLEGLNNAKEGQ